MSGIRPAVVCAAVLAVTASTAGAAPAVSEPLPARMADTGGGDQLITAEAPGRDSTTGEVIWWENEGGIWSRIGSAEARFGANGLTEGRTREQGTSTTPTGLYDLPFAFGADGAPAGTGVAYRKVTKKSWWCEDNASTSYNRWVNGVPEDCAAEESEHLIGYPEQYRWALVIGFNYHKRVKNRGAGIFLHVNGRGTTAGCVSVPASAMRRILQWADPDSAPYIAIGTTSGATRITRY